MQIEASGREDWGLIPGTILLMVILGLSLWTAFILLVLPPVQVPYTAVWLLGIALGATRFGQKLPTNILVGAAALLLVVFFEPLLFFGGPIFLASLVAFPFGMALLGAATGGIVARSVTRARARRLRSR